MGDSRMLGRVLETCAERGDRIGFTLADGREFLGWVEEVTGTEALVSWAPSPVCFQATGGASWALEDEWVALADIGPESLGVYDESERCWVNLLRP
ncbi:hypothetical protein ACFYOV_19015 [Streptomyces sp. NPDC005931]|uniref:hypothetical protein n=1 Tax=Streptomyces sp. NPDC005931 TaxID=3364737 RepID=UPI00369CC8BE